MPYRQTEEVEPKLEELMPDEDILEGKSIIENINEIGELMKQQRQDISKVFENLQFAHEHLANPAA